MDTQQDIPQNGWQRPRGIFTQQQIEGYRLMCKGAVSERFIAGIANVNDGKVRIVSYDRQECNCGAFRHSHPRVACRHLWAAYYTVEPPTEEEVNDLKRRLTGEILPPLGPGISLDRLVDPSTVSASEIERASERVTRGGYTRFAKEYESVLKSGFGDQVRLALAIFTDYAAVCKSWKPLRRRGRRQKQLALVLFAAYVYTYMRWSIRETEGFLEFLAELKFIPETYPKCGTLSAFLRAPEASRIIDELIALTAEPFRDLGVMTLAGDATGAAADRNKFFDYMMQRTHKKKQLRPHVRWYKAFAVCGVDTMQTVLLHVTNKDAGEKTVFRQRIMTELEFRQYDIDKFLYDGGCNFTLIRDEIIEKLHATPYIPWASNSKNAIPRKWRDVVKHSEIITELHRQCTRDPATFKMFYRHRVKIECLFSAVKEKFGQYVRTCQGAGPENEIKLKFLAYNVRMLVMAAKCYQLDINNLITREKRAA